MSRSPRTTRRSTSRLQPRVEALESRRLLSVAPEVDGFPTPLFDTMADVSAMSDDLSTLSVVSVDPPDGAVIPSSPSVINVTFNQPFEPLAVFFDFALYQVSSEGSPPTDLSGLLGEPFDLTGTPTVLPVTIGGTLDPGTYQLVLLGSSMLSGIGVDFNPGAPLATAGTDTVISTFTIQPPIVPTLPQPETLSDAVELGTIGAVPLVTAGSLDTGTIPGDYHLYKFELGAGHFWRFGAEVTAQRDGGSLNTAIALFDSDGQVLKTAEVGRVDALLDPYLFAGLAPGTYYVGVSGSGNLPDLPGGYDPLAGRFGEDSFIQDSGPYRLHLLAQVEDTPTQVRSVELSYADSLDPRPTGIVVTFAGPMDILSFQNAWNGNPGGFTGLRVLDDHGNVWPLTPVRYDERTSQFAFLFTHPLETGKYRLIVPEQGGVTDLAGLTPVAPDNGGPGNGHGQNGAGSGEPGEDVLAAWHVTQSQPGHFPNNLGVVLVGSDQAITGQTALGPNDSVTYRFVAPVDGLYEFRASIPHGVLSLTLFGSNGSVALDPVSANMVNGSLLNLTQGVYLLQVTNVDTAPVVVNYALYWKQTLTQNLFDNGVGQGPALNLVLIDPAVPAPTPGSLFSNVIAGPAPLAAGTTPADVPTPDFPGLDSKSVIAATTMESPSGSSGLVLTLGNSLVGTPSPTAEQVAVVGPGTQPGVTALAASGTGVLQGINYGQSLSSVSPYGSVQSKNDEAGPANDVQADDDDQGEPAAEPLSGALVTRPEPPAQDQDERVLAAASDWFGGLGSALLSMFGASPQAPAEPALDTPAATAEPIRLARDDAPRAAAETTQQVEHADLAMPLGLGVLSVLALRARRPVSQWIGRRSGRTTRRISAAKTAVKGPHARI